MLDPKRRGNGMTRVRNQTVRLVGVAAFPKAPASKELAADVESGTVGLFGNLKCDPRSYSKYATHGVASIEGW